MPHYSGQQHHTTTTGGVYINPRYNTKAVAANSATITKVAGATLTWAAYKTSLQSALTLAGL